MGQEALENLAETLGQVLPDEQGIRDCLWDAGLEVSMVSLTGKPVQVWRSILGACVRDGVASLESLLAEAADRRPDNPQLRDALRQAADLVEAPIAEEALGVRALIVQDPLAGVARLRALAASLPEGVAWSGPLVDIEERMRVIAELRRSTGRSLVQEPEWAQLTRQALALAQDIEQRRL